MSTTQNEGANRGGRPRKAAEDRKSETLRFRVREDLKARISAGAAARDRSLSEEAEDMLARFYEFEPVLNAMMRQDDVRKLFVNIASLLGGLHDYEAVPGQPLGSADWNDDTALGQYARATLRAGIGVIVEHSIPRPIKFEDLPQENKGGRPLPTAPASAPRRYVEMLNEMHDFGERFGKLLTGQDPETEEALDRRGNAEH